MKIPDTFFPPIWEIDFPSLYKKREALKAAIPTSGSLKFKSNDLFFLRGYTKWGLGHSWSGSKCSICLKSFLEWMS